MVVGAIGLLNACIHGGGTEVAVLAQTLPVDCDTFLPLYWPLVLFENVTVKKHLIIHEVRQRKFYTPLSVILHEFLLQVVWDWMAGFVSHNQLIQSRNVQI